MRFRVKGCSTSIRTRSWLRTSSTLAHGKFIFKSDGEHSLVAVKKAAVSEVRRTGWDITVAPEESPVGDSQKNGYVERATWEVQSLTSALVHKAVELHNTIFT